MKKTHPVVISMVAAIFLLSAGSLLAQDRPSSQGTTQNNAATADSGAPSDEDIQLLRKDLRSQKKQIVAANMKFTDAQAEKFWPVYDRYTAELSAINDRKVALITQYMDTYDTMNGEQAKSYIQQRGEVEESILQLKLKYIPLFGKVLTGRQTALLYQIDWRVGLLSDLQLAHMPLIDQ